MVIRKVKVDNTSYNIRRTITSKRHLHDFYRFGRVGYSVLVRDMLLYKPELDRRADKAVAKGFTQAAL